MKIFLDLSPQQIAAAAQKHGVEFGQLRTPLTNYRLAGIEYGIDNGCFTRFLKRRFYRLAREAEKHKPRFITMPDIVGDARRTLDLFDYFKNDFTGLPRALVLQDGIGQFAIPWRDIDAVFVGGGDSFKYSAECVNACKAARLLGKWVHVGRVNDPARAGSWRLLADSIDGSGISRFDSRLSDLLKYLNESQNQQNLFDEK